MQDFTKEDFVGRKYEQVEMYPDTGGEEMESTRLDKKRERHWRMVFKDSDGGD